MNAFACCASHGDEPSALYGKRLRLGHAGIDGVNLGVENHQIGVARIVVGTLSFAECRGTPENCLLARPVKLTPVSPGIPYDRGGVCSSLLLAKCDVATLLRQSETASKLPPNVHIPQYIRGVKL